MRDLVWRGLFIAEFNERCWLSICERERTTSLLLNWTAAVLGSGAFALLVQEVGLFTPLPALSKATIAVCVMAIGWLWFQRGKADPAKQAARVHSGWVALHGEWRAAWARSERGEDVSDAIAKLHAKQAELAPKGAGLKLSKRQKKAHYEATKEANAHD